jgi:two-component system cell cycle response regulator
MDEPEKKKHILLADDDPASRRLFGAKLASAGFEVLYAKDGNEALEMATRFVPDLVITDVDMPNLDGIKESFRLRSDPRTEHIPIIFLTNADLSADAEKAINELGKAEYIPKATDLAEFIKRVEALVL